MAGLCKLLKAHNVGAKRQFVNTDDRQAALLVEFATLIVGPLHGTTVKSASMLRRHACEPVSKTAPQHAQHHRSRSSILRLYHVLPLADPASGS